MKRRRKTCRIHQIWKDDLKQSSASFKRTKRKLFPTKQFFAVIFLQNMFKVFEITAVKEMTLTGNQELSKAQRLHWNTSDKTLLKGWSKFAFMLLLLFLLLFSCVDSILNDASTAETVSMQKYQF